eukprot:815832-Pyramimonas_sp.AAC.1
MFLCILGRVPLDAPFVWADEGSHALEGCSSGLGPTVRVPLRRSDLCCGLTGVPAIAERDVPANTCAL